MTDSIVDQGLVVALDGDQAQIEIETGEACESCGARVLCAPGTDKLKTITAYNEINAVVGDLVEVREGGNLLLKLSLLQYGPPLIGFLTILFTAHLIYPSLNELLLFICGLGGGAIGALLSWLGVKKMSQNPEHFLSIGRILKRAKT